MKPRIAIHAMILPVLLVVFFTKADGQINIAGIVKDSLLRPIPAVSVKLVKGSSKLVVAYAITDHAGHYIISNTRQNISDSLSVQVSAIGYASQSKNISGSRGDINFILSEHSIELPQLSVKNARPFIRSANDTVNYYVDSFKNETDRNIGDVLRRMPGITVNENGRISYNGKSIANFYIDGDNLLDDKYNLATNSIAADLVDKVQVLENHQHIKALKNVSLSEDVALNISLKDNARLNLHGSANLAGGYSDEGNYAESVSAMAFTRKYKSINAVTVDNTGSDPTDEVISHNFSDYLKQLDYELPNPLLRIGNFNSPNIDKRHYLFNHSVSLNTNNLFKTKNGTELKLNTYYINDKSLQSYQYLNYFFLPSDTIRYTESQAYTKRTDNFFMQATVTRNLDRSYINNKTAVEYVGSGYVSNLVANGNYTSQNLSDHKLNLSNEFSFLTTSRKKVVFEISSYINYLQQPQTLSVSPGVMPDILNGLAPYSSFSQYASVPTFFSNNYISARKSSKHFLQSYKVGVFSQQQRLNSDITKIQLAGMTGSYPDSFVNRLHWNHIKLYEEIGYTYITQGLQITSSIPFNQHYIRYSDTSAKLANSFQTTRTYINPLIRVKLFTGTENYVTASYSYASSLANIEDVFKGYIVENYQLLAANAIGFGGKDMHNITLGYNFKNTFKLIFFNVMLGYNFANSDYLPSTEYDKNVQRLDLVSVNSPTDGYSIFTGVSKLFSGIHSTISLRGSIRKNRINQLQNNLLNRYDDLIQSYTASLNTKPFHWLTGSYSITLTNYSSRNIAFPGVHTNTDFLQQNVEINFIPKQYLFIRLKGDAYFQRQADTKTDYLFMDGNITYKIKKIKTDLILELTNLANIGEFKNISLASNNYAENAFRVRPRMILLKAYFNF